MSFTFALRAGSFASLRGDIKRYYERGGFYASVNSSSAHPPPPRADPRELAFYENELANAHRRDKKGVQMPGGRGSKMFYFLRFST